jgi:hypothetical protein
VKDRADHFVRVGRCRFAHSVDRLVEQARSVETANVFGDQGEDQPRHEVVQIVTAVFRGSVRFFRHLFQVRVGQAAGGVNVDRTVLDFFDGEILAKGRKTTK